MVGVEWCVVGFLCVGVVYGVGVLWFGVGGVFWWFECGD